MTEQPNALLLADKYAEAFHDHQLHASRETRHDMLVFRDALDAELRRLVAQRDALLEACKAYDQWADKTLCYDRELRPIRAQIRAAINKAEEEE